MDEERLERERRILRAGTQAFMETVLVYLLLLVAEAVLARYIGFVGSIRDQTPILVVVAVLYIGWRMKDAS